MPSSVYCASNYRGQIKALCQDAKDKGASVVIHCGDFGLYDINSYDTLNDEALLASLAACPVLSHDKKKELRQHDMPSLRRLLKNSSVLSELASWLEGKEKFSIDIPIYVIHGALDDDTVAQKFLDGAYSLQNLYLINTASPPLLLGSIPIRIYGASGDISESSLFDVSWSTMGGMGPSQQRNLLRIGRILAEAEAASQAEVRILAVSKNPSESPLVYQLAAAIQAKVVIAPTLARSGVLSSFNFSSLGLDQYLKFRCQEIEKACDMRFLNLKNSASLSNDEKSLLQLTERVWRTAPKSDEDTTFFNLPDRGAGHVLLQSSYKELIFSSQCKLSYQPLHDDLLVVPEKPPIPLSSRQSSITSTAVSSPLQDSTTLTSNTITTITNNSNNNSSHSSPPPSWFNQGSQDPSPRLSSIAEATATANALAKKWDSGRSELYAPPSYWDEANTGEASMADASMTDSRAVVFPGQAGGAIVPASNAWERISVNSDRDNWDYASMSSDDSEDVPIECGAGISTLWVGNIPEEATEHDLRVYFRSVPIVKIRLSKKRPDKRPCAYVDVREEDMDRALRLSGERLLGARLKVEYDPSRLQKLRKRRQNLAEGKPESPESLNDIERMRITPGNSENEPWVPGQLRKWSSTSALDVAAALPKKTATTLQRSVGKPSLEGTLTPNPISISTSSAGTKSQWSNAANPGGRLTSSRSMNSLAGEPSTLNTALPAGWSTHANPNSSWDSPPRKPMSFTSGAEWDRPNEGGGGGKWDAALRPPSTLLGGPKTAPPSAAPVAPWSMEGAPTIVGAGRMPLKNGGNTMMNDSSQGGNVNWTMYGKTGTGLSAGLDDGSWMQQNGGGGQGGAKPGWNAGRTFAQADASPASFQASWNQRGGMVGGDHGGNWMGGGASASANRMTNSMGQSQSNVGGMIGAEVEQMPTFAPGWMRGHAMGGPPHMPVSGGPPPHAIRRKGSLPNLPLMGGKGASWEHNPNSIKDPSTLWVNHPTAPVLDPAAWSALSRKKEAAGIWKDLDGNTQNGSGGKLSPVVQPSGGSSSRLPPGPVTGMPSVNVSVTPIGHAWEAAKAVEQQINVAAMEAVDTKVWGPTGWHPEWRRT